MRVNAWLMGIIVMITGLPGTGKSTFGRQLQKRLGARYLNTDLVREQLGKKGEYDPQSVGLVYETMAEQARQYLQEGSDVIADATFHLASRREMIYRLAAQTGHRLFIIAVRSREETIRQRLKESRPHSEADFGVYLRIRDQYEPLRQEHLELWSDRLSPREMVNRTIQKIHESETDRTAD